MVKSMPSKSMPSKSMHKWMSHEMARLSTKLERYKPTCSGYNRIQPILLSRSVTQMLNNPLPVQDQIGNTTARRQSEHSCRTVPGTPRVGVLSRSPSEWEEVYPTVVFDRQSRDDCETERKFAYYRNCSTRIT